jgi:membrane-bound ClpP family serine protease
VSTSPQYEPAQSPDVPPVARRKTGLGVAALVIGVASLVAALSFVLFPLAIVGGIVALVLGLIALIRGRAGGTANLGQAAAGLICAVLALAVAVVFTVRVGTFVARNTSTFTTFDKCIAKASNRSEVATCMANLANRMR